MTVALGAVWASGCAAVRSRLSRLIATALTIFLLTSPLGDWGEQARADGGAPRADDWITINKNYFGQRYVDLDQIMPRNVGRLKEVCEIQLDENSLFSTGLLKVGRTLYLNLSTLPTLSTQRPVICAGFIGSNTSKPPKPVTIEVLPTSMGLSIAAPPTVS